MNRNLKSFYLILSSLFISLLHLPFAFGKSVTKTRIKEKNAVMASINHSTLTEGSYKSVYDSLKLDLAGLSKQAFDYAKNGWEKLKSQGRLLNQSVIAIVDFSQPSTQKRLYVLDMNNYKVLYNTLVAHGRNSGKENARYFSNKSSSYKSSPGFYITGDTYNGSNGYSLRLDGIEKGINDNALSRAIVMHGADYVNEAYIASRGYIGRSQGCPAVPLKNAKAIINTLRNGACLYIYAPDQKYLSRSSMLAGTANG